MLAIYRKYRPKKFEDVLGQEALVQIIKNQAKTGNLARSEEHTSELQSR